MMKIIKKAILLTLCASTLGIVAMPIYADSDNPYGVDSVGCITDIKIQSNSKLLGSVTYFNSVVTSRVQGLEDKAAIPYNTYGAIGSEETKMFVYSVGTEDGLDFTTANVKTIVEAFERENPQWKAVAAVNGDFFDIETKVTASYGEPEFPMVQMGDVYKANVLQSAVGRGVVGVDGEGNVIYYTVGSRYAENGYGTPFVLDGAYQLQLLGESRNNPICSFDAFADIGALSNRMSFITPDSYARDLGDCTVYVVKCDTYRRAHVGINGAELGTKNYFIEGEIVEIREGSKKETAPEGHVLFFTPDYELFEPLKVGGYIKCQKVLGGYWKNVENAIGFKQQILAQGNILLKNCYGRYNTAGDPETKNWTEDIYDYPYCWKDRTAIGFREDGTPVLLVIQKSFDDGDYQNLAASYYEIGEQLKALGCVNGFLFDGGGSSTMVIRNTEGELVTAYCGEGDEGRHVANAVILAVRDESVEEPTVDETIEVPTAPETEKPTARPTEERKTDTDKDTDAESTEADSESGSATSQGDGGCASAIAAPALMATLAGAAAATVINKKRRK